MHVKNVEEGLSLSKHLVAIIIIESMDCYRNAIFSIYVHSTNCVYGTSETLSKFLELWHLAKSICHIQNM